MYKFFLNSYDAIKIKTIKDRIEYLKSDLNKAHEKKNLIANNLNDSKTELSDLENQYVNIKMTRQRLEEEVQHLNIERSQLDQQLHKSIKELEKANNIKDELHAQLSNFNLENIKAEINALKTKMQSYDTIINQPEPKPEYRIDGEYCINNIYHCKNHPPKQVLINEKAIEQHKKAVADALKEKEKLQNELQKFQEKYNQQTQLKDSLEEKYKSSVEYFNFCQQTVDQLQQEITNTENLYNQTNQELENNKTEENKVRIEIENLRGKTYGLEGALNSQDAEVQYIENRLADAELELEQAIEEYQNLQSQLVNQQQNDSSEDQSDPPNKGSLLNKFGKFALDELKKEGIQLEEAFKNSDLNQLRQKSKEFFNDLSTTVSNLWPAPVGTLLTAMFDGPHGIRKEFFGETPGHTGDMIVDYAIEEQKSNLSK